MATESPLVTWYEGEQKLLRWTVVDRGRVLVPVTGWNVTLSIYRRRDPTALYVLPVEVDPALPSTLTCLVTAAITTALGPGSYRYVLARTDPGAEQVIASEDIVLNRRGA